MRILKQFWLLLWKNYVIQKRKTLVTIAEIGLPTFFAVILILIRRLVKETDINQPTIWEPPFSAYSLSSTFCPTPGIPSCYNPITRTPVYWQVYYAPNNTVTYDLMEKMLKIMGPAKKSHISNAVGFPSEDALVKQFLSDYENAQLFTPCTTLGGIIFTNLTKDGSGAGGIQKDISYKIRLPYSPRSAGNSFSFDFLDSDTSWHTDLMFPLYQTIGPRENTSRYSANPGYKQEGFLALQHNLDRAIIHYLNPDAEHTNLRVQLQRHPYPKYKNDMFVLVLQNQFPFIIMLSFVFSALHIVKDLVYEKEKKLKESMKMMGLSNWIHWMAWFIKYLTFLMLSIVIMTVLFSINVGQYGSVVGCTHWSILFVFLLLYGIASINFCFAISVFFSKANTGAAAGGIIFFLSYMPYSFLQPRYLALSHGTKLATCLMSNVAMCFGAQIIGMFEGTGAGVQWSTINKGATLDDEFTMAQVFVMLLFDSVLYAMITWYMEAVWPGEYGVPRPWYFPFQASYWCGRKRKSEEDSDPERTPLLSSPTPSFYIEPDPSGLKAGIHINNLTKVFKNGDKEKVAVNKMNLNMYEGQITALLGHNGAGKTTTMSMLTGFFPSTSGTAVVNDCDILTDIDGVRQSLGLCPQHNVLFDSLTVEEHLYFFATLKGCSSRETTEQIDYILSTLNLQPKRHALTKTLSGGMKRKLSVGIALIGDSKIVILDEPTSGMDPEARRQTWNILQHHRGNRTIVLTTHFMDEADVLADRIAIMADGVIQCSGTPLFLKNRYGAGYHLVMVKEDHCDVEEVTEVIQSHVPDARLERNISAELSYILPHESKARFTRLFNEIEDSKEELRITSYGISVTTMEEVFLRVGEGSGDGEDSQSSMRSQNSIQTSQGIMPLMPKNTGFALYRQQFHAMFKKRVIHTFRNWLVTLTQLGVPLFFTILGLIVIRTLPRPSDSPPLILNVSNFDQNYVPYGSGLDPTTLTKDVAKEYAKVFQGTNSKPYFVNESALNITIDQYLIEKGTDNIPTYNTQYMIAAEFSQKKKNHLDILGYFNGQAFHTSAMTLNAIDSALLRFFNKDSFTLTTVNHPFPRTVENQIQDELTKGFEGFVLTTDIVFGMSFLTSSFVLFLIKERVSKAKHCQFVSGVHSSTFWTATFTWDLINYMVPCVLLIFTFVGFGVDAYVADGRFMDILLLFLVYGCSVLPLMYLLSFLFSVPSSGFVWLTMLNIFSGIATFLAVSILEIPALKTLQVSRTLENVFLVILPNFCLGKGLSDFYANHQYLKICDNPIVQAICVVSQSSNKTNPCCKGKCGDNCLDYNSNYLSMERGGIGRMLLSLSIQAICYFLLLMLIETHFFQEFWYSFTSKQQQENEEEEEGAEEEEEEEDLLQIQEDSDVAVEKDRVLTGDLQNTDSLVLKNLTKYYGRLCAVDRLCLAVPQGQCFGLLGINGAGKTSTFKMLTGDEIVSEGEAYLNNYSIKKDILKVRQQVGYCPQFDALIDQMTGREMLTMFAQLRGVPVELIQGCVDKLMRKLLLEQYSDKMVCTYSGGNKRKLSTAIALIGDPSVIFLDEPSTGMDPRAKRLLWDTLSEVRSMGRTLILTSHSMEECEALCTRLAIMVNGQFKCLGSSQHLKTKFGEGYSLIVKVAAGPGGLEHNTLQLTEHIQRIFPGSILKDVHQGMLHFHITDTSIKWSQLFSALEDAKDTFNIEDYSISQTTLEQVFINFARSQLPPQEPKAGCCRGLCHCCCRDKARGTRRRRVPRVDTDRQTLMQQVI